MQNISCLLAGGIFFIYERQGSWTHHPFYVQGSGGRLIVGSASPPLLAKFTHLVQRGRGEECLAHTGEIYPGLLVPAEHNNSPQLHLVLQG